MPVTARIVLKKYSDICGVIGVSKSTMIQAIKDGCPGTPGKIGGPGDDGEFDVAEVIKWFRVNRWEKRIRSDDDPLMDGGSGSEWLERYRKERAKMARLDRLEREGILVRLDVLRPLMFRASGIIRQCGETLAKLFGNEAAAILNDALNDVDRELNDNFDSISKENSD